MEFFQRAKVVSLRSRHDKYLAAEEEGWLVTQDRNGSSEAARWMVELVPDSESIVRLRSFYGYYLTASNQPFRPGMTGGTVLQTPRRCLDSSADWEPVREGTHVKLRTSHGNFLQANGGLPPWRDSVTHDIPQRTSTQDWVLWDVDIIETYVGSPPRSDERTVYYHIADGNGNVVGEDTGEYEYSFRFKGNTTEELTRKLREQTGMEEFVVCCRSPLNGKLYPLRLYLPPNNATMRVVVVPSGSTSGISQKR